MSRRDPLKAERKAFGLALRITRQLERMKAIEERLGRLMTARVDAEEKLARLYRSAKGGTQ